MNDDRELDPLIREALGREEAEVMDRLHEPSLPDLITSAFRGRFGWLNLLGIVGTLPFVAGFVVCLVGFAGATEVPAMLRWLAGLIGCLVFVGIAKIWFWLELQRIVTARELKRLELQVARLAASLRAGAEGPHH